MQAVLGIFFHFIGGFASGSFYIPYKKVKGWAWESYWIVGGIFSWLFVPPLAAWLTIPHYADIIRAAPASTLGYTYLFGVLWGIGGLTFGLGIRYLGVSLGSSIMLGLCSVFGALIPAVYYELHPVAGKDTISMIAHAHWGQMVLLGILVCIIGIILCGLAGSMKDKDLAQAGLQTPSIPEHFVAESDGLHDIAEVQPVNKEFNVGLGLTVAIISGILSACFAFGIDAGKGMANTANTLWKAAHPGQGAFLYQNNVTYVIILWGGLTTNLIWCMILNARNKTFTDYTNRKAPLLRNYIFSAMAGITWFLQFFFYGMGESRLGNGASSWILHMAFIILVANLWGIGLKEWKGVRRKTFGTVIAGIVTIIISVLIVGYGNSLK